MTSFQGPVCNRSHERLRSSYRAGSALRPCILMGLGFALFLNFLTQCLSLCNAVFDELVDDP